jgi:hypothetical protein
VLLGTVVLLTACGASDDAAVTTTARPADCQMTAAAARRVHARLLAAPPTSSTDAGLVLHELAGEAASTSIDPSPDGRDVFVLVNAYAGVAGLRGSSGSRSITLTARQGCGAVGYLRHSGPYRARFTLDGKDAGSTGPG